MTDMRVGVVIIAYNVATFLQRTIDSVTGQTHPDWVCVVVDDGSPDDGLGIAQMAARLDHRITAVTQANGGQCRARNTGAALLPDVDAYLFLDGDDALDPDTLERLIPLLEGSSAPAAFGQVRFVDTDDHIIYEGGHTGAAELYPLARLATVPLHTCPGAYLIRSAAFEQAGRFDPGFGFAEDWHLVLKLARLGPLVATPESVVNYRKHAGGLTTTSTDAGYRATRKVRHAIYTDPNTSRRNRRDLRRAWRKHNATMARTAISNRRWLRATTHLGLIAIGRPLDLSKLPVG